MTLDRTATMRHDVAMQRILVGVDGSAESLKAVTWTADLARSLGAEVIVASVYGFYPVMAMPSDGVFMSEEWLDGWRTDLQRDLEGEWTKPLRDAGVPVVTRVEQGLASEVLLRLARENGVYLIVVGSRGFGAVREAILGSVSHVLALHAPCPVVVLPHHHGAAHAALPVPQTASSDPGPRHG